MDAKIVQQNTKIKKLLQKFTKLKCPNNVDVHLKKLLDYLWRQADAELPSSLVTLPLFTKWLVRSVTTWERKKVTPPVIVASFTLNVASLLSKNEKKFNALNRNNFFIKLINVVKARQPEAAISVKSSYIKLLSTFLEHKSGIEWITVCTFWEDILKLNLLFQDVEIVAVSCCFLAKLLDRTIDYDADFCNDVTKRIMEPLGENIYKTLKAPMSCATSQRLRPNLKLIGNILEYFLDGIFFERKDFRVVLLFYKNFYLDEHLSDFMILATGQNFVHDLAKITFTMQFLQLYLEVHLKNSNGEDVDASVEKLKANYCKLVSKGCYEDILEFFNFGSLYWRLIDLKIAAPTKCNLLSYSDHCNCFVLNPNFYLLLRYYVSFPEIQDRYDNDEGRNFYGYRFLKRFDHTFYHVAYGWRNYLTETAKINQYSLKSLTYLKKSRKYFTRESAVLCFHHMYYLVQDMVRAIAESPKKLDLFHDEEYFSKLFELLAIFLEEFHITWKDNFEVVNVMSLSVDFLMLTEWPSKVIVQVLNLVTVATREFMTPNMALLVDTTSNSALEFLGPLLSAKLLDGSEVKIAALELIYTMARMCGSKFPSLQKVLMDSELPTLVVKMSTCDSESFVRATAIKCLQEMIQVEEIWNNALKTEDLPQKMRDVLLNETEGIVRVEAATFMCVAYENQQLPKETLDRVYETMIYSSTTDLHWEVKVRALDFWDKVIKNHLQNQGMIDGSFPNVTFSKEHRKIVTLTDSEIRKRLLKVLSQLSSIGCLGVLMSAIKDDCDMEVSKTAAKISQGLVDLFKKYNVRSDGSTPTSPLPTENGMSTASVSSGVSVDESMDSPATNHHDLNEEIIDQIVNSKDICLLKNVYTPSDYGSVSNYDIQVRRIVTPNEFLQFTQQDLNSIINEKKNWLNGIEDLGSLLDDMLKTYDDDVNNMDCY